MIDRSTYREMYSHIHASWATRQEVMNMTKDRKSARSGHCRAGRAALLAAMITLAVTMTMTVFASESIQNWLLDFFEVRNGGPFTQERAERIEDNTRFIMDSQTHNGWTVELHSAIRDERKAYIVFRITGPDDTDLSLWTDENGAPRGQLLFGNGNLPALLSGQGVFFDYNEHMEYGSWGYHWMDDGDGIPYTGNIVFFLEPETMHGGIEAFGEETVYHFHFQDIIWYWMDMEYERELRTTKYQGQSAVEFTDEEMRNIHRWETLAEGTWEFEISFGQLEFVEDGLPDTFE